MAGRTGRFVGSDPVDVTAAEDACDGGAGRGSDKAPLMASPAPPQFDTAGIVGLLSITVAWPDAGEYTTAPAAWVVATTANGPSWQLTLPFVDCNCIVNCPLIAASPVLGLITTETSESGTSEALNCHWGGTAISTGAKVRSLPARSTVPVPASTNGLVSVATNGPATDPGVASESAIDACTAPEGAAPASRPVPTLTAPTRIATAAINLTARLRAQPEICEERRCRLLLVTEITPSLRRLVSETKTVPLRHRLVTEPNELISY